MKEKKIRLTKTPKPEDLVNLRGKRISKWMVMEYAGKEIRGTSGRASDRHWWKCRCKFGHIQLFPHAALIGETTQRCRQCREELQGARGRLLTIWRYLRLRKLLSEAWLDFDTFCRQVGEPPAGKASIRRYDSTQPHGPENTYWVKFQKGSFPPERVEALQERRVSKNNHLLKVRAAKSKADRIRTMLAARKAGCTFALIAHAAGITRQYVYQLIGDRCEPCRKRKK